MSDIFPPHEDLKPLFEQAHREGLWFQHTGMHDEVYFSPYELEERMREGYYCWSAVNWKLMNWEDVRARHFDRRIKELEKDRARFEDRVRKFERRWHLDHRM